MLNLILKDLRAHWPFQVATGTGVVLFSTLVSAVMLDDGGTFITAVFVSASLFLCLVFAFTGVIADHMYKTEPVYASLPVDRSRIVQARYATVIAYAAVGYLLALTSIPLAQFFQDRNEVLGIFQPANLVALAFLLAFVLSWCLPCYFRFGLAKGIWWADAILLALLSGPAVADFFWALTDGYVRFDAGLVLTLAEAALDWADTLSPILLYAGFALLTAAVVLPSAALSVRLYRYQDL